MVVPERSVVKSGYTPEIIRQNIQTLLRDEWPYKEAVKLARRAARLSRKIHVGKRKKKRTYKRKKISKK